MEQPITSSGGKREPVGTEECEFCREPIHRMARICKACGEPQKMLRRSWRWFSEVLAVLVALGSLGLAFVQSNEAQDARKAKDAAVGAKELAILERYGAEDATETILKHVPPGALPVLKTKLQAEVTKDPKTLEEELRARPADRDLRRQLYLRKAMTRVNP